MGTKWGTVKIDVSRIYGEIANWAFSFPQLEALVLFGSYARGMETPMSDVDMAYLLEEGLSSSIRADTDTRLYNGVSRLLGTDEVTLLDMAKAPISVAFSILREGKLLFCRNLERMAAFRERVLILYPEVRCLRTEALADFEESLKGVQIGVEREKILYYLHFLQEEVASLKELARLSEEEYLSSDSHKIVAERRFQSSVETCLNIGNHIISRQGLRLAEDYASVFTILADSHVISKGLAEKMADMARFRNLLVHVYWDIDHERIYQQMSERINSLDSFIGEIYKFITHI